MRVELVAGQFIDRTAIFPLLHAEETGGSAGNLPSDFHHQPVEPPIYGAPAHEHTLIAGEFEARV